MAFSKKEDKPLIDVLSEVYNSWLSRKIEDFNGSIYYESPAYLFQSYLELKTEILKSEDDFKNGKYVTMEYMRAKHPRV